MNLMDGATPASRAIDDRATIRAFTAMVATMAIAGAAVPYAPLPGDSAIACAAVGPGAVLADGAFVLIGAPAVGQSLRGNHGALVGPLGCFDDAMPPPVFGDLDGDGAVNGSDLGALLGYWGACPGCPADFDGSGVVDGSDLGALLGAWTG